MDGWRTLIATTTRLAAEDGAANRRRTDVDGRLLFEAAGEACSEHVQGILAAAWALSAEICDWCGGPGDPDELIGGEDLAALMDARYPPAAHRGWPVTAVGGRGPGHAKLITSLSFWT